MEFILSPWPWYVAGPIITIVMALLLIVGRRFGISSSLQVMCSMAGASKWSDYFKIDWKSKSWLFVFIIGSMIGGYIASNYLMSDTIVSISDNTIKNLESLGMENPGMDLAPDFFTWGSLFTLKGIIIFLLGGFFVGFGVRWANGCTSGHAISGLSNLQLPSLIAVIGFFIGGLIMTWLILPHILTL